MVTTKHCCYGLCTSDSRYPKAGVYFIGFGNGFPKPTKEKEKCQRWVHNCGRGDFSIKNVNKDTYICSLHFVGGNGPTDENPDPIKLGSEVSRVLSCVRVIYRQTGDTLGSCVCCLLSFIKSLMRGLDVKTTYLYMMHIIIDLCTDVTTRVQNVHVPVIK